MSVMTGAGPDSREVSKSDGPVRVGLLIRWIQSDTLLRTEDQLITETMRCLGLQKRGSRIVAALTDAIERSKQPGLPPTRPKPPVVRKVSSSRKSSTYRSRSSYRPRRRWVIDENF